MDKFKIRSTNKRLTKLLQVRAVLKGVLFQGCLSKVAKVKATAVAKAMAMAQPWL